MDVVSILVMIPTPSSTPIKSRSLMMGIHTETLLDNCAFSGLDILAVLTYSFLVSRGLFQERIVPANSKTRCLPIWHAMFTGPEKNRLLTSYLVQS